jgi:hypothetical protein
LPDANRIAFYLSQATDRSREECQAIIDSVYTENVLREEMLFAARPTLRFLKQLGVLDGPQARQMLRDNQIEPDVE